MRSVKVKLLKKIKTMRHCKPERVLRLKASDGYIPESHPLPPTPPPPPPPAAQPHFPSPTISVQQQEEEPRFTLGRDQVPEIIEVSELMKDLEDEEMEFLDEVNDKENLVPVPEAKISKNFSPMNPKIESLRSLNSRFAPFSEIDSIEDDDEDDQQEPPAKARRVMEKTNPFLDFDEKCPPGGSDSVIIYTTGLRGIPKTYEDCQNMTSLLKDFRVLFFERDISIHSEFKEELWELLGQKVLPPRLFIRGRYIGGAEQVFALHEQGKLKPLLEGIPLDDLQEPCGGCVGMRFILCYRCSGSKRLHLDHNDGDGDHGEWKKCPECNENGLILCPFCC